MSGAEHHPSPIPASTPTETPTHRKLHIVGRMGLVLIPISLILIAWGMPTNYFPQIQTALAPEPPPAVPQNLDGAKLFVQHCAYCHGERGDGNGIASLTTKARYFGNEPYKFTMTTGTKIPTDDQLLTTIRRGIPGSSMPSFSHLHDLELRAILAHIRTLTRKGMYEYLWAKAKKDYDDGGDEPNPVVVNAKADAMCQIGTPLQLPAQFNPVSPESIANGKKVFLATCAACHGQEGKGDGAQVKDPNFKNANGTHAIPRNLTTGVFKGGREKEQLYARIKIGIPGTPMPEGATLNPQETSDLINYVLSLSDAPPAQALASK